MSGPVRLCFLIDTLSRAGTESQLLALIASLDREQVLPHLVLLNGTDAESAALEPTDCPVLRLGLQSLHRPSSLKAAARLVRFWRQHRIDVVQTYFLDSTYFGVPLARLAGIRRVVRVRNNVGHWLTPRHRHLGRLVGRLADVTLTNSEPGLIALQQAEGLPEGKLALLENGVDLNQFPGPAALNLKRPAVRIGAVANLRPVKGIDELVRAAAIVVADHPEVSFHVAGEGEQRGELEQLIADHDLFGRFHLQGAVADVPEFLASVEIAVVSSRAEGMSNALLEAMAARRAIVATDVGGNSRLIRHDREGLLTPPTAEGMAAAIRQLLGETEHAQLLADAARGRAEAEFSRDAMRRRFEAFYQRLAS